MRFAHLADLHLGSWRQPELQDLNIVAFRKAIDSCIEKAVDFVIMAGDIFDTAMPSIDILKEAASELRRLKEKGIECYVVAGSHDFSLSGKSFLDVLEKAGLCKNVVHPIENEKIFIAGVAGKKTGLEIEEIKKFSLKEERKNEDKKFKIFVFHSMLNVLNVLDEKISDSISINDLPEGFNYYAAGHLHLSKIIKKNEKYVIYPGPIFPTNFVELEKLKNGCFYIFDTEKEQFEKVDIALKDVLSLKINLEGLDGKSATKKIISEISAYDTKDKIVLLRLEGKINGKISDIELDKIYQDCYVLLKNISGLASEKIEMPQIEEESLEEIEKFLLDEFKKTKTKFSFFVSKLLKLDIEKQEDESVMTFEEKIFDAGKKIFGLDLK